jgi:hypothetical protein
MQWIDSSFNEVIAFVNEDGNIELPNGNIINHIGTPDELKITTGDFDKQDYEEDGSPKPITFPGKGIGILQIDSKPKSKVKLLRQMFNFIPDGNFNTQFIEEVINKRLKRRLFKVKEQLTTEDGTKKFIKKFMANNPEMMSNAYMSAVEMGGSRHPVIKNLLLGYSGINAKGKKIVKYKGLVVDKTLTNTMNLGGFPGTIAVFTPDINFELGEMELNLSFSNAKFLKKHFKSKTNRPFTIQNLNKWLKNNSLYVLVGRSPIPHPAGILYMRINKVLEQNGLVEFNPITVKRYFEGDQDIDKAHIALLPESLDKPTASYFNSEQFSKHLKGISLKEFVTEKDLDVMVRDSRYSMAEAMNMGVNAISQIANIQTGYRILHSIIKDFTIGSIKYTILDPNKVVEDSNIKKGFKEDVQTILRMYLQSAVDNVEYLLLDHWNWTRDSMMDFIVVSEDGEKLSAHEGHLDLFRQHLWTKVDDVLELLNAGKVDDNINSQLDFDTMLIKAEKYYNFIKDRTKPDFYLDDKINVVFREDAQNVNEQLAVLPYEGFVKGTAEDSLIDSIFGKDSNKLNELEYTPAAYLDAHIYALTMTDARVMKDIDLRWETYKKEFNVTTKEDFLKRLDIVSKRYSIGSGRYHKGLLKDLSSKNNLMAGRPIFPDYWTTNEPLINLRQKYAPVFEKLSRPAKQLSTLMYLKELTNIKDIGGNMRFDFIPMPVEVLLDKNVMKSYFTFFDQRLDASNKFEKSLGELKCL